MKTIGLIGVGTMGAPMGESLLRAGFALRVCAHGRRDRVEKLVAAGAVEAPDPAAVAAGCDALITMVPDAPQVEEALFGPRGAAQGLRAGSRVIDMSTISPVKSRSFHERLASQGVAMLDAPVSGGPARAADGTLAIIEAMKKANSVDPAKFTPEMFNVSFTGATGTVAFDAKGDRKDAEMTIFRMHDGKIVPVAIVKGGVTTPFPP